MSYFELNMQKLRRRQPVLARHLCSIGSDKVEAFASASSLPTASYRESPTKTIPLHSRYDPMREARAKLREYNLANADYVILLGFGLGYMLDAILEQGSEIQKKFFIVESDPQILQVAFEVRDLTAMLSLPSIHFAWPLAETDLANQWLTFFDLVHARQSIFVMHAPSLAINPEFFKAAAKAIQSQTLQIFTDVNTLIARADEFLSNLIQNIPYALPSPGIAEFAGLFRKTPGILVSAGPSLDKNIHELRLYQEKVVVLSTDTALKPLLQAGIEPHLILTGDPSEDNYRHLKGARLKDALLVAEATTYPGSFEEFRGQTICCTYDGSALGPLCALIGNKGKLRAWGSVATMALDCALFLGCNPIIFIGQDLAYSDDRTYCSGVWFIEEFFREVADVEAWQKHWDVLLSNSKTVLIEDIFGKPIRTTDRLISYWNWIVKQLSIHSNVTFINATEGGILKENVVLMSLREALYRHCNRDLRAHGQIKETFARTMSSQAKPATKLLADLKKEALEIEKAVARGKRIADAPLPADQAAIKQELEAIKKAIYTNAHLPRLLDTFNQLGNVAFLRQIASLEQQPSCESTFACIQKTHADYFNSVARAMEKIETALGKIEKAFP